jgi:hypothetical protein
MPLTGSLTINGTSFGIKLIAVPKVFVTKLNFCACHLIVLPGPPDRRFNPIKESNKSILEKAVQFAIRQWATANAPNRHSDQIIAIFQ